MPLTHVNELFRLFDVSVSSRVFPSPFKSTDSTYMNVSIRKNNWCWIRTRDLSIGMRGHNH